MSEKDPAQDLYKNVVEKNEEKDNSALWSLIFAILSVLPIINILNFFFIYNIVSTVFAIRVLRRNCTNQEKVLSYIALIINILLITYSIILLGVLFSTIYKNI